MYKVNTKLLIYRKMIHVIDSFETQLQNSKENKQVIFGNVAKAWAFVFIARLNGSAKPTRIVSDHSEKCS